MLAQVPQYEIGRALCQLLRCHQEIIPHSKLIANSAPEFIVGSFFPIGPHFRL
jgi:hypothetical protein